MYYKKTLPHKEKPCKMTPQNTDDSQGRLFLLRLDNMIDMNHELVRHADKINWKAFEKMLGEVYLPDRGR